MQSRPRTLSRFHDLRLFVPKIRWSRVPDRVSPQDAAALPASGEAAARVVEETGVAAGETVLVVGAAGSVGPVASQLAVACGARVLAAVRPGHFALVEAAGATPVGYGQALAANVRAVVPAVDAVIDAAGSGVLRDAVELVGVLLLPFQVSVLGTPSR